MSKIICAVCESDSFENIDGFYYCSICGSQSRNVCDIELSDEELAVTGNANEPLKEHKVSQKEKFAELENSIEQNFSTFEVLNCLLKRQCDDLIKNGVSQIIKIDFYKEVVLKLWIKYLQKLEIAFVENESEQINLKNVKWKRDKFFFEIYHLDLNHSKNEKEIKNEQIVNESFDFGMTSESEINTEDYNMVIDTKIENDQDTFESDEESMKNDENFSEDELENSKYSSNEANNTLLTKFESIRMPHTIALLNLGLLIIKSQFLITDLIRLIYDGKVSYFNIDDVLPDYMEFKYKEDSSMFNHISVPKADYLRYLTSKLGTFLEIDEIELIEVRRVSYRYLLDLNLPNQLISIVDLLMEKAMPIDKFSIKEVQYENIEAIALSYILVSYLILFIFDHEEKKKTLLDKENIFYPEQWILIMQNRLSNVENDLFGCEYEKVLTVEDLKSLKLKNFKQRHKLKTKKYLAQYRRHDIISTLNAPLEQDMESIESEMNNLDINTSLFFISKSSKYNLENVSSKTIEPYLTSEKLNIIGLRNFKSKKFREFFAEKIEPMKPRGRYVLGLETSTFDWLIEVFAHIAQTKNFFQMLNYVIKLLRKIK